MEKPRALALGGQTRADFPLAYDAATATLTGTYITSGHLRIADNGTTIATLNVVRESSGGDAPLDEG